MYNYSKQIAAWIILIGHMLTSCTGPNLAIPAVSSIQKNIDEQQLKETFEDEHCSPCVTVDNKHITFVQVAGKWWAEIREATAPRQDLPSQQLPAVFESGYTLTTGFNSTPAEQRQLIHIVGRANGEGRPNYIYIGREAISLQNREMQLANPVSNNHELSNTINYSFGTDFAVTRNNAKGNSYTVVCNGNSSLDNYALSYSSTLQGVKEFDLKQSIQTCSVSVSRKLTCKKDYVNARLHNSLLSHSKVQHRPPHSVVNKANHTEIIQPTSSYIASAYRQSEKSASENIQGASFSSSGIMDATDAKVMPNKKILTKLANKVFTANGGHLITFEWMDAQWIANVDENVPSGFSRKHKLRVYLVSDMTWQRIANMNKQEQEYRIHVIWGKGNQKLSVVIGSMGLLGGEKSPLHLAVRAGNLDLVKKLIGDGADKEEMDMEDVGCTPLHMAVLLGHLNIVRYLIEQIGANVITYHDLGANPLQSAAAKGHLEIVKYLIEVNRQIDIDSKGRILGNTPLHMAAAYNKLDVVVYLLQKGANKEICNNKNETPLHIAAKNGYKEIAIALTEAGAELHAFDERGLTPIEVASEAGHLDLIKQTFQTRVNINSRGHDGLTHLHRAVQRADIPLIKELISCGANRSIKSNTGETPVHLAFQSSDTELLQQLIEALGINIYESDSNGNTLLHRSILKDDTEIVKALIRLDIDKNIRNNVGRSPLHYAVEQGNIEIVKLLLDGGAEKEATDQEGNSLLHIAIQKGNMAIVKYLVESDTDLHSKNKAGLTPIDLASVGAHLEYLQPIFSTKDIAINQLGSDGLTHLYRAIKREDLGLVKQLIYLKANVNVVNRDGYIPLQQAVSQSSIEIAKQLVEGGANMPVTDKNGMSVLHIIASSAKPHIGLVIWLAKKGLDVNLVDRQGNTAFHIAIENGHIELAKQLLVLGADPYVSNKAGLTPLHLACQTKQIEWIKHLSQQSNLLPLHWAIKAGDLQLVRQLVELGLDINVVDQAGWSGVHWAADQGNLPMLKYLIEEAHLMPLIFDKQGKTPLDMARRGNQKEVIDYLQELVIRDFQARQEEIQGQMAHQFRNELQESLRQILEGLGMDPDVITPEDLAIQWLNNIQAVLQGNLDIPTILEEDNPDIRMKVDDFLNGIQAELQEKEAIIPEIYREAFRNFPVESIRPYATAFVKELEQEESIFYSEEQEKEVLKELSEMISEFQEEAVEELPKLEEQYHHVIHDRATEKTAVPSIDKLFISEYRISNVEDIKEYFDYVKQEINQCPSNIGLSGEQKNDIKSILEQIEEESEELISLYRELKSYVVHRGGDILFLEQEASKFNHIEEGTFEQEARLLQKNVKDVEIAKNLLEELKAMREELYQILAEKGEGLPKFGDLPYKFNFENDYTNEELMAYLANCGVSSLEIQRRIFTTNFFNNLSSKLVLLIEGLDPGVNVDSAILMQAMYGAYQLTEENRKASVSKDQAFVSDLSNSYGAYFKPIIKRLDQEAPVVTQDFQGILQNIPLLSQYTLRYCPNIICMPMDSPELIHITNLVLQAIIKANFPCIEKNVQLKYLTEIKKRIHKLTRAIQKTIKHQPKLLTYQAP